MKKEKKIKTELDYLKAINSTLGGISIGLIAILLILFVATIGIYVNADVTANAASENLLSEPITVEPNCDPGNTGTLIAFAYTMDTLNLKDGKDYNITYTYGGTQYTQKAQAQLKDTGSIVLEYYEYDGSTNDASLIIDNNIVVQIQDRALADPSNGFVYSETNSGVMTYKMVDNSMVTFEAFTIDNITEYGVIDNSSEDLSAGTIVENITGSFTTFLTGTGDGIVNFFDTIFTNEDGGISVLGIVALSMMGLGIATGVIKFLLSKAS